MNCHTELIEKVKSWYRCNIRDGSEGAEAAGEGQAQILCKIILFRLAWQNKGGKESFFVIV